METFYQLLTTAAQKQDQYLRSLAKIAQASHSQIQTVASDLAWQAWGEQTADS